MNAIWLQCPNGHPEYRGDVREASGVDSVELTAERIVLEAGQLAQEYTRGTGDGEG